MACNKNLFLFTSLFAFSLAFADQNAMLAELDRDNITLTIPKGQSDAINPLKSIRPATYKDLALDYVFHSFSEMAEDGISYPLYRWYRGATRYELLKDKRNSYQGSIENFATYAQLSDEEKNLLWKKASKGLISGALTKKTVGGDAKQRFLLIGKKSIYTLDQLALITDEPAPVVADTKQPEAKPKKSDAEIPGLEPFGIPAPGQKGIVYFPLPGGKYNAEQPIDISGMTPGERMRCPYTGKIFRVP